MNCCQKKMTKILKKKTMKKNKDSRRGWEKIPASFLFLNHFLYGRDKWCSVSNTGKRNSFRFAYPSVPQFYALIRIPDLQKAEAAIAMTKWTSGLSFSPFIIKNHLHSQVDCDRILRREYFKNTLLALFLREPKSTRR